MDVTLRLDNAAVTQLLQGPDGLVGRDLQRRVLNVHAAAVRLCPVDTGRLRSSIRWSISQDARGLVGIVGTDVNYAIYVHEPGIKRNWAGVPFLLNALNSGAA